VRCANTRSLIGSRSTLRCDRLQTFLFEDKSLQSQYVSSVEIWASNLRVIQGHRAFSLRQAIENYRVAASKTASPRLAL
jgi:hypothetical protein